MRGLCLIITLLLNFHLIQAQQDTRPRVIINTDIGGGDPDDQQSLVRLLLYSNELNLRGFCATSFLGHGYGINPDIIHEVIDAYGKVEQNLRLHDPRYPAASELHQMVKSGHAMESQLGNGFNTEASDWIIREVDASDQPTWILVWGGSRELAQALWKAQETKTNEEFESFLKKIRTHLIGDQDGNKRWILNQFPEIYMISNGFVNHVNYKIRPLSCYRGQYMTGDQSMQDAQWVKTNVSKGHGALGAMYPVDGAGTNGMKEGDTPSFTFLLDNGLAAVRDPSWGSWGGRFRRISNNLYVDSPDLMDNSWDERYTVSRWRSDFQRAFMARLDWCTQNPSEANHEPVIILNGEKGKNPVVIKASEGDKIKFETAGTMDPDGDQLEFHTWLYHEPSYFFGESGIDNKMSTTPVINVPEGSAGKNLHFIMQVQDNGEPALTSYQRIILQVE